MGSTVRCKCSRNRPCLACRLGSGGGCLLDHRLEAGLAEVKAKEGKRGGVRREIWSDKQQFDLLQLDFPVGALSTGKRSVVQCSPLTFSVPMNALALYDPLAKSASLHLTSFNLIGAGLASSIVTLWSVPNTSPLRFAAELSSSTLQGAELASDWRFPPWGGLPGPKYIVR